MGEDAAAATASFLSWCDARGLVLDGVALRDAGDAGDPAPGSAAGAFLSADAVARGRGVYARRAFEPKERRFIWECIWEPSCERASQ